MPDLYIRGITTRIYSSGEWQDMGIGYRPYMEGATQANELRLSAYRHALATALNVPTGDIKVQWQAIHKGE